MKMKDVNNTLVLGAGTMGQQIGFLCAMHGYQTTLFDISEDMLKASLKRMEKLGTSWFVAAGRITSEQCAETMGRIHISADPARAAEGVDIVSECLPEDPALKGKVFAQFNELCPEHTIFTTNTSTLLPSQFAEATGRPDKVIALHFHDARMTDVVDVMPHPGTDPAVAQKVHDFAVSIGQTVIMLHRENHGYVFNAMLANLFYTAMTLVTKGVASLEDVDRAWMGIMQTPIGPFGIMDQVGLQTVWTVLDYWSDHPSEMADMQNERVEANVELIKQYVDRGELGAKTGKGFYSYPMPAYAEKHFLSGQITEKK